MNKNASLAAIVIAAIGSALWYWLFVLGINLYTLIFAFSGTLLVVLYFYVPDEKANNEGFIFKDNNNPEQQQTVDHVAIWDRCTVDMPPPSYLQLHEFKALYFCTTTGVSPDMSLIRNAIRRADINHWEYRTDSTVNLQVCLLLTLYHIKERIGTNVVLHIFTTDIDLQKRMKIHANGYGFRDMVFKNGEME